jgi:GTPase SAR1 family protein
MASIKVVLLGSGGVGKSALCIRLTTSQFVSSHDPTVRTPALLRRRSSFQIDE